MRLTLILEKGDSTVRRAVSVPEHKEYDVEQITEVVESMIDSINKVKQPL